MFEYKYKVPQNEDKTTYGSLQIRNIVFEPGEIEKALPEIVFDDDNLKHMFAENELTSFKRKNIYRRFIPKSKIAPDINSFVEANISTNKSFYSFLAEGILGLVYRDLYDFSLAKGVIDSSETTLDSHTGVDACLYNLEHHMIVLGEAKFYEDLGEGIHTIINDFVKKSIKNKLESLQTKAENCEESYNIILKNLQMEDYKELPIEQFMKQKIVFAGFVLHSEENISRLSKPDFYNKYFVSFQQLKENICKALNCNDIEGNYEIILVHLPIQDKKSLIVKIMEMSKKKLNDM